jgi:hypothetical protein
MRSRNYLGAGAVVTKVAKPIATKNRITFTAPGAMNFADPDQSLEATALAGETVFESLTSTV